MAGHLPINDKYVGESESETKAIRKLVKEVRAEVREVRETEDQTNFRSKYTRLPDDYLEKEETEAYIKQVDVPETVVWGGRATLEVHFRMSRINNIFLVV